MKSAQNKELVRSKRVSPLLVLVCSGGCKAYLQAPEVIQCLSAGRRNLTLPMPPFFLSHLLFCLPQYVWDRMLGGFKHKNFRTREGICLCLIATLNA